MKSIFVILAIVGTFLPMPQVFGIRNGWVVPKTYIPFQARIVSSGLEDLSCGGILISRSYVMTSASCLISANRVDVTLGATNLSLTGEGEVTVTSSSFVVHENYNGNTVPPTNNIAIIELPSSVELSSSIGVAKLASDNTNSLEGLTALISGWGATGLGELIGSDLLRAAPGTIVSDEQCREYFGNFNTGDICLSGETNDIESCEGDAGGPLIVDDEVVGVASYSEYGCGSDIPSVYTSVADKYSWIVQNSDI